MLAANFAFSVFGFSVIENHLLVLCWFNPYVAKHWLGEEVVRRWISVYQPRTLDRDDAKTVQMWVDHEVQDSAKVAKYWQRLAAENNLHHFSNHKDKD